MIPHPVRVRFAPSPTGELHVGGLRTALFNWLYARHHGGQFILRLEDTDRERFVPGSEQGIFDALAWLGLTVDEGPAGGGSSGPYVQSARLGGYREAATRLIAAGQAYECTCSPARLQAVRQAQAAARQPTRYDRHCRNLTAAERAAARAHGGSAVVRLRVPESGSLVVTDVIRGPLTFPLATLDDAVLLKSDGFPTYHLAVVVDDHAMAITHVIRAEEWLPSLPKHLLLYQAFGWTAPTFAHIPLLLGRDRTKLSKRHGATAVQHFIAAGYLPAAMLNFLALLGWNPGGDRELMNRDELIRAFSLDRVQPSGAVFDTAKLDWMNLQYLKKLSPADFGDRLVTTIGQTFPAAWQKPKSWTAVLASALRDRIKRFDQAAALVEFVFVRPAPDVASLVPPGRGPHEAADGLRAARSALAAIGPNEWTLTAVHAALDGAGERAMVRWVVRVSVTGQRASPPVYESVALLDQAEALERIDAAIRSLDTAPTA